MKLCFSFIPYLNVLEFKWFTIQSIPIKWQHKEILDSIYLGSDLNFTIKWSIHITPLIKKILYRNQHFKMLLPLKGCNVWLKGCYWWLDHYVLQLWMSAWTHSPHGICVAMNWRRDKKLRKLLMHDFITDSCFCVKYL